MWNCLDIVYSVQFSIAYSSKIYVYQTKPGSLNQAAGEDDGLLCTPIVSRHHWSVNIASLPTIFYISRAAVKIESDVMYAVVDTITVDAVFCLHCLHCLSRPLARRSVKLATAHSSTDHHPLESGFLRIRSECSEGLRLNSSPTTVNDHQRLSRNSSLV